MKHVLKVLHYALFQKLYLSLKWHKKKSVLKIRNESTIPIKAPGKSLLMKLRLIVP
jgi:hypothetical protein